MTLDQLKRRAALEAERAGAAVVAVAPELVALAGFVATVAGVRMQFGDGWALIAGGLPLTVAYVAHELRVARGSKRED